MLFSIMKSRNNKCRFFVVLLTLCLQLTIPLSSIAEHNDARTAYLNTLVATATQSELHYNAQWLAILHYKPGWFNSSLVSLVDEKEFFLSPNGKRSPKNELIADILALDTDDMSDDNPQCKFPARYDWLDENLHLNRSIIAKPPCARFKEWFTAINPDSLTLIFPSAYINSPASAFGHTLIRINQPTGDATHDKLLYYAASFAAETNESDSALLYAVKGLFGLYNGYFTIDNYYTRVNMYADSENRDIWEYDLTFTRGETEMLVKNLWELRGKNIDYYYFDDNCAYVLLSLLDVARPSLDLAGEFDVWVTPVDTVKVIMKRQELVDKITFLPSLRTKLEKAIELSSPEEVALAKKIASPKTDIDYIDDESLSLSEEQKARVLDLSTEYLSYILPDKHLGFEDYRQHVLQLLIKRSKIEIKTEPIVEKIPTPEIRPDQGHESSKLNISAGHHAGRFFYDLKFNFAYHELLDPQGGFQKGSELLFFNTMLRYEPKNDTLKLNNFVPLQLKSFTPINQMITPVSWKFRMGIERKFIESDYRPITYFLSGGAGLSFDLHCSKLLGSGSIFYALVSSETVSGDVYKKGYGTGAGAESGLLLYPTNRLATNLSLSGANYFYGDHHRTYNMKLDTRYTIVQNWALRGSVSRLREYKENFWEFKLGLDYFF